MSDDPREIVEYEREDGSVRDGIEEEDNKIPAWFTWSFVATIVWGFLYMPYYTLSGWSQEGQYAEQVAAAEARAAAVRAELPQTNPFHGDATAIAEGQEVWNTICVACHKPDGSGLVGPSLVDPYSKYGDDDLALYETVAKGRPGGMPPWEAQLGSQKIWKVLAFMETLPRSEEPGLGAPDFAGGG